MLDKSSDTSPTATSLQYCSYSTSLRARIASGDPASEARKPKSKAQALGQVCTDAAIADRMVLGLGLNMAQTDQRILDPCVGPYTFPAAISRLTKKKLTISAFDIDPEMCDISDKAAKRDRLIVKVSVCNYLTKEVRQKYDFAILNPPYVRQEWIDNKPQLREHVLATTGSAIPGTSNLYVYFIVKVLADLKVGGSMACIIYDSWQSTIYGQWLKQHLDENCANWRYESVPARPFEGRLIDATIIYATKGRPSSSNKEVSVPEAITRGLAPISDIFSSKRGLRLKQSDFFLTTIDRLVQEGATPFIKKVSKISGYVIADSHPEAALLLSDSEGNRRTVKTLNQRLAFAHLNPSDNISILTWNAERRAEWNKHKTAPRDLILFNYYMRHRPRHILNPERRAYSDNFYGLTPKKEGFLYAWLAALNATASVIGLLANARNQGAGLAKLQLFEYRNVAVVDIRNWTRRDLARLDRLGKKLASAPHPAAAILTEIDLFIASIVSDSTFQPSRLSEVLQRVDRSAKQPKVSAN